MQSENDSPTTATASPSEDLENRVLEKYARIKGLSLLSDIQLSRRSSQRLDAQARAVRKQQGLEMEDPPDEEIVLGDKTVYYGAMPAKEPEQAAPQQPVEPPQPQPQPEPAPPVAEKSLAAKLAPYVATALLTVGAVGAVYMLAPKDSAPADQGTDTDTLMEYTPGFGQPENIK